MDHEESARNEFSTTGDRINRTDGLIHSNGNEDGLSKDHLINVRVTENREHTATDRNGTEGENISHNLEDWDFNSTTNGTRGANVNYASQTELFEVGQNEEEGHDGGRISTRNKAREGYDSTRGDQSDHIQILSPAGGYGHRRNESEDSTSTVNMIHGEGIHWTDINEDGSGSGGSPSEEGSRDGRSEGTRSLGGDESHSHHNDSNGGQPHDDGMRINLNRGGDGDGGNLDDSLNTSEQDSSQDHGSKSPENDDDTKLGPKAKNEQEDNEKQRDGTLGPKDIAKVSWTWNFILHLL